MSIDSEVLISCLLITHLLNLSIVRQALSHDPWSCPPRQARTDTIFDKPTNGLSAVCDSDSWRSFAWLALRRKERSSTNWEWLERAVPVQDTRPHLSWDRIIFFFIGATRPHLPTISTFNFWPTPPPPGDEGPKIRTGQRLLYNPLRKMSDHVLDLRYSCDRNH